MPTIIIAEASLELVPKEICNHPQVRAYSKKRNKPPCKVLLDKSFHYNAMRKLKDKEKRGRPDIVHIILLNLMGSPLNKEGKLRVFIHTINDLVIFINPKMKVPRNYYRFVGLIEQLFEVGKVPPDADEPLMYIRNLTFKRLVKNVLKKDGIILMTEDGELVKPDHIAEISLKKELPVVIGGFPRGDFGLEVHLLAKHKYSIYPSSLDSWVVADRIVEAWERKIGIYNNYG